MSCYTAILGAEASTTGTGAEASTTGTGPSLAGRRARPAGERERLVTIPRSAIYCDVMLSVTSNHVLCTLSPSSGAHVQTITEVQQVQC